MGLTELVSSLADNPYFGAGFGLFGLGAGTAALRKGYMIASILFRRHYMTVLEIPCRDKSYSPVLKWITERGARDTIHRSIDTNFVQSTSGKIHTKIDYMPMVGDHFFWYRNNLIKVERNRAEQSVDLHSGTPWESVKLTTFGRKNHMFDEIILEARKMCEEQSQTSTIMYTPLGSEWRVFGHPRNRRPLTSVVLGEQVAEELVADVQDFVDSSQWYIDRGIPYRRGYLLHGPPGCGKSSFITALAGHLQLGVCVLNLGDRGLTDDRLNHLLAVAPESSIILLEDIDAAFPSREESLATKSAYEGLTPLTFSGLLNCLDGVASTEARIVFMTTNYIDRLDPALVRPGRVDLIKEISYCTQRQLEQLFVRFYPQPKCEDQNKAFKMSRELCEDAAKFAEAVISVRPDVSAAEVQGHFLIFKHDRTAAINNVAMLKKNTASTYQMYEPKRCG